MASDLPECILNASKEAVQQILPDKSYDRYVQVYEKFSIWQKSQNTDSFDEEVLLAYFCEGAKTFKPSTLWSVYSMLKTTINCNHNVNIAEYARLIAFLKKKNYGFKSKKSNVFTADEINKFLTEAPDAEYLAIKTVMLFGIYGACTGDKICNVRVDHVKDHGTEIVVQIPDSKTKVPKACPISGTFAETVRKYITLRPPRVMTDRFFIKYREGKCTAQVVGKKTIVQMPRKIAEFLELPYPAGYTWHSFRSSSTTILQDGIETIKRNGVWESNSVAEGYIQESLGNKRKMVDTIASPINLGSSADDISLNDAVNCTDEIKNGNDNFDMRYVSTNIENDEVIVGDNGSVEYKTKPGVVSSIQPKQTRRLWEMRESPSVELVEVEENNIKSESLLELGSNTDSFHHTKAINHTPKINYASVVDMSTLTNKSKYGATQDYFEETNTEDPTVEIKTEPTMPMMPLTIALMKRKSSYYMGLDPSRFSHLLQSTIQSTHLSELDIMLTLRKLHLNEPFETLGDLFDIDKTTTEQCYEESKNFVNEVMDDLTNSNNINMIPESIIKIEDQMDFHDSEQEDYDKMSESLETNYGFEPDPDVEL